MRHVQHRLVLPSEESVEPNDVDRTSQVENSWNHKTTAGYRLRAWAMRSPSLKPPVLLP